MGPYHDEPGAARCIGGMYLCSLGTKTTVLRNTEMEKCVLVHGFYLHSSGGSMYSPVLASLLDYELAKLFYTQVARLAIQRICLSQPTPYFL